MRFHLATLPTLGAEREATTTKALRRDEGMLNRIGLVHLHPPLLDALVAEFGDTVGCLCRLGVSELLGPRDYPLRVRPCRLEDRDRPIGL